jgi:hypothetical protein
MMIWTGCSSDVLQCFIRMIIYFVTRLIRSKTWVAWLSTLRFVRPSRTNEFPLNRVATSRSHQIRRRGLNLGFHVLQLLLCFISWISKGNIPAYSLAGSGYQTAPARPADPHNSPAHSSELLDYIIVFATLTLCIYVTSFSEKREELGPI